MGSLIGGGLGAALGFWIGGPAGAKWGFEIGAVVGGIVDPGVPRQDPGKLSDTRVSGSSYGTIIPYIWGKVRLPTNCIWSTQLHEHTGGKGKGGGQQKASTYSVSYAANIARQTPTYRNISLIQMWADDIFLYDSTQSGNGPNGNASCTFNFYSGSHTQGQDPIIASHRPMTSAYRGTSYICFDELGCGRWGNRLPNLQVLVETDPCTVGDCITDLLLLGGIPQTAFDVSRVQIPLAGKVVNGQQSITDALAELITGYALDCIEVDGVLRFQTRSTTPLVVIPYGDLGATIDSGKVSSSQNTPAPLEEIRQEDLELPRYYDITYVSSLDYCLAGSQTVERQASNTTRRDSLQLGLTLDDNTAIQIAARELYRQWREREGFNFALPFKYFYLTSGDCVTITRIDNSTADVRLKSVEQGLWGELRCKAVFADAGVYAQTIPGSANQGITNSVISPIPISFYAWSSGGSEINQSQWGTPGFYVVGSWEGVGSGGGQIYTSIDNVNYVAAGPLTGQVPWGSTTSTLATYTGFVGSLDSSDTVGVSINHPSLNTLSTTTQALAQVGANLAKVGSEYVGFVNANLTSSGNYTLGGGSGGIFRGLNSTPMSGHTSGEAFVLLNSNVSWIQVPTTLVGQPLYIKVVGEDQTLSDVAAQEITITAPTPSLAQTTSKTVAGLAAQTPITDYFTGDGSTKSFKLANLPINGSVRPFVGAFRQGSTAKPGGSLGWTINYSTGYIQFVTTPPSGAEILVDSTSSGTVSP